MNINYREVKMKKLDLVLLFWCMSVASASAQKNYCVDRFKRALGVIK